MSQPISVCTMWKAARGDEAVTVKVIETLVRNIKIGHFSTWPCEHQPPCQAPTTEQLAAFDKRLFEALKAAKQKKT